MKMKTKRIILRILASVAIFAALDLVSGFLLVPDSYHDFRTEHYYYHHGLRPGQETMAAWGALIYPMYTNSMGLVDSAARRIERESDRYRIMILGDSHSEGVGVPYGKTFAGRLAEGLAGSGMEVINASAVSYSQKIEYLKARYLLETEKLVVDEILVPVDISDIQNELVYEEFNPRTRSAPGDFLYRSGIWLKKRSAILYLIDAIHTRKERDRFFSSIETFYEEARRESGNNIWELYSGFFSHFDDEVLLSNPQFHGMGAWLEDEEFRELAIRGIDLGQQYMVRLKELCDRHGIRLTLSVHPWHHQIRKGETTDEYVQLWEGFAISQGIGFINLYPLFIGTDDPETVIRKYYIQNDNHWNEFGHEVVADSLKQHFTAKATARKKNS